MYILIDEENKMLEIFKKEDELAKAINDYMLDMSYLDDRIQGILNYWNIYHIYSDFIQGKDLLHNFNIKIIKDVEYGESYNYEIKFN